MKILLKGAEVTTRETYTPVTGELLAESITNKIYAGDNNTPGGILLSGGGVSLKPDQPAIITPVSGITQQLKDLVIITSPYSGPGVHQATRYVITSDAAGQNVVYDHTTSTDLTSLVPYDNGMVTIIDNTTYYIWVYHFSSTGDVSDVSAAVDVILQHTPSNITNTIHNPTTLDYWGSELDVTGDGSRIAIGLYPASTFDYAGRVYIYDRNSNGTYDLTATIFASDASAGDCFGRGVSLTPDGGKLAVGAQYKTTIRNYDGKVYIYEKQTDGSYLETQTITDPLVNRDWIYLGAEVCFSRDGNMLFVCRGGGVVGSTFGAGDVWAMVLDSNGQYVYESTFYPSSRQVNGYFGYAISCNADGTIVAAGSSSYDLSGTNTGRMFVFERDSAGNYIETQILQPYQAGDYSNFGQNAHMNADGTHLYVSMPGYDGVNDANIGTILMYTRDSAGQYQIDKLLQQPLPVAEDRFGSAIGITTDEGTIVTKMAGVVVILQ